MHRTVPFLLLALTLAACGGRCKSRNVEEPVPEPVWSSEQRSFRLAYEVEVRAPPGGGGPLQIFVPLAQPDERQRVLRRYVEAPIEGDEWRDQVYDNRFWRGRVENPVAGQPITIRVNYEFQRAPFVPPEPGTTQPSMPEELMRPFHAANDRVPIEGELVDAILGELPARDGEPGELARAAFDLVVSSMKEQTAGEGAGEGDTRWAWEHKAGTCADYGAVLASILRARGIAARMSFGLEIPEGQDRGTIENEHCWLDAWLPAVGWFALDPFKADREPQRRDHFFGRQPADRVTLTIGRDLVLGEGHQGPPLSHFSRPYVELAGEPYTEVTTRIRFESLTDSQQEPR
jgi:transglutaminase-like putative cysteine protease